MEPFFYISAFVIGTIVGSFCNVLVYRLHTGRTAGGRSHCLSCGAKLHWYELIPVLSYLLQRGRCRSCSSHIPARYILAELLFGILFVLVFYSVGLQFGALILGALLVSVLAMIAIYDLEHMIIPDELVLALSGIALATLGYEWLVGVRSLTEVSHTLIAGVCAGAFFGGLWLLSRGQWMGLGDAKLALPLGVLLAPWAVFSMVVFSFWIGAFISVAILASERGIHYVRGTTHLRLSPATLRMKSEVPFAPFLILAFTSVYFFHVDIFSFISIFSELYVR